MQRMLKEASSARLRQRLWDMKAGSAITQSPKMILI
jgi:hypothetical protein